MLKKIQKNILLNKDNYYIKDNKLFVDNIEIQFTKKSCKVIIEYICDKCGKLHKQELHKHIPEKLTVGLLCTKCKVKQTNLKKYGVESSFQREDIKEKIQQTNLKKYGIINPGSFGSDSYKNKIKEKYGVTNISQLKEVKEKKKKSYINKYGVEFISQSKQIKEKIKQTNLKKYGKEYYLQSSDSINKTNLFRKTNTYKKFINFNTVKPLFSLDDWIKTKDKYKRLKWECTACGNKFYDYYANGRIPRCKICYPFNTDSSESEKELAKWCKTFTTVIQNDRSILEGKEIDIYLPDYKLAIEYNGLYWHSIKFIDDKWYHQKKVELAYRKDIRLLHVWEYQDMEEIKQEIQYYINNQNIFIEVEKPKLYNIENNLIWL